MRRRLLGIILCSAFVWTAQAALAATSTSTELIAALSKRIASVESYDITYITSGSTIRPENGSTYFYPVRKLRCVFKSGKCFMEEQTNHVGRAPELKEHLYDGSVYRTYHGLPKPNSGFVVEYTSGTAPYTLGTEPDMFMRDMREYMALFQSLPKTFPLTTEVERLNSYLDECLLFAVQRQKEVRVFDVLEVVHGHECIRILRLPEQYWLDSNTLDMRRRAHMYTREVEAREYCFFDFRPLEGTRISIPWHVESKDYLFAREAKDTKSIEASKQLAGQRYWKVTRALGNAAVDDSVFSKPFHPDVPHSTNAPRGGKR